MRKTNEELNSLCGKYNVDKLYSWSRYKKYKTSPYEYLLSYILHIKEDRESAPYAAIGGGIHDILEKYYNNEIAFNDILENFKDYWNTIIDISQLKFDRSSDEKNNNIQEKYYNNLLHFCKYNKPIQHKLITEQFIVIKVGQYVFQGYMDGCFKDDDGNYNILDFKTSTIYKGEKAIGEAGQLILYAEGLRQLGVPLDKIKICWNFLKYVNVKTELKNGKNNIRQIERSLIGESLKSNSKTWLKHFGYSKDEINNYIEDLIMSNDIKCLPKEVQEKYIIDDCYVFVQLTQDIIDDLKVDIVKTLDEVCEKEIQYNSTKNEALFFDNDESVEKQSYYFTNLCGYSANLHKPYKKYLEKLEAKKNGISMFNGVGAELCDGEDDDLDWLNSL